MDPNDAVSSTSPCLQGALNEIKREGAELSIFHASSLDDMPEAKELEVLFEVQATHYKVPTKIAGVWAHYREAEYRSQIVGRIPETTCNRTETLMVCSKEPDFVKWATDPAAPKRLDCGSQYAIVEVQFDSTGKLRGVKYSTDMHIGDDSDIVAMILGMMSHFWADTLPFLS